MVKCTNGQMNKCTNGQMNKWSNAQMHKWSNAQMHNPCLLFVVPTTHTNAQVYKFLDTQVLKYATHTNVVQTHKCRSNTKILKSNAQNARLLPHNTRTHTHTLGYKCTNAQINNTHKCSSNTQMLKVQRYSNQMLKMLVCSYTKTHTNAQMLHKCSNTQHTQM